MDSTSPTRESATFTAKQRNILQAAADILRNANVSNLQSELRSIDTLDDCEIQPPAETERRSFSASSDRIENEEEPDFADVNYTLRPPVLPEQPTARRPRNTNSVEHQNLAPFLQTPMSRPPMYGPLKPASSVSTSTPSALYDYIDPFSDYPVDCYSLWPPMASSNVGYGYLPNTFVYGNLISTQVFDPDHRSPQSFIPQYEPDHFGDIESVFPSNCSPPVQLLNHPSAVLDFFPQNLSPKPGYEGVYNFNSFTSSEGTSPLSWTGASVLSNSPVRQMVPDSVHDPMSQALSRKRKREDLGEVENTSLQKRQRPSGDMPQNDIKWTRQNKACVRCRNQKIKCRIDPTDIHGPCLSCREAVFTIYKLPCLRYKITDSSLCRTKLCAETSSVLFTRPNSLPAKRGSGKEKGRLSYVPREWAGDEIKILSLTQDPGRRLDLRVRQFIPPDNSQAHLDCRKNRLFGIPWCLADHEETERNINQFADDALPSYLEVLLDDSDRLVYDVFHYAYRLSMFPEPNKLLQDTLRLWTLSRCVEGGWRCCGTDNIGAEKFKHPHRPDDWIPLPSFVEHEFFTILVNYMLPPLGKSILHSLEELVTANSPGNWYLIFLTTMILMHNYEMGVAFQTRYSRKRKAKVQYMDMSFVRAVHSGAKTILAHFHYCCKGEQPFRPGFDWRSPEVKKMAGLDSEQLEFMEIFSQRVHEKNAKLQAISQGHEYGKGYWFTSQVFDLDWKPRETLEHSPAANKGLVA